MAEGKEAFTPQLAARPVPDKAPVTPAKPSQPSKIKKIWQAVDIDAFTFMMMLKAGLAPTIGLAIYLADPVAELFGTVGFLVAVAALIGMPTMPRAIFIQNLLLNVVTVCFAAAVSLLATWSGVMARLHTTAPGGEPGKYNSSQSAVCGIWLFVEIFMTNYLRSARPQYTSACILASIFAVISLTTGASFPNVPACLAFIKRMLTGFLTGFALSAGVSLFIVPVSARRVVFKQLTGYIGLLKGMINAQTAYLQSLERTDMFVGKAPQAGVLVGLIVKLKGLAYKLDQDMVFAKREIAYDKLTGSDLGATLRLLRSVITPIIGVASLSNILSRAAKAQGWDKDQPTPDTAESASGTLSAAQRHEYAVKKWQGLLQTLHESLLDVNSAMIDALEHVLLVLEFKKAPKNRKNAAAAPEDDVESKAGAVLPGQPGFAAYIKSRTERTFARRKVMLRDWYTANAVEFSDDGSTDALAWVVDNNVGASNLREGRQRQVLIVLHLEHLLRGTNRAILNLVEFADSKIADGTMKSNRFQWPAWKQLRKWAKSLFTSDDSQFPDEMSATTMENRAYLATQRDPDHLPPEGWWQKFSNSLRVIPHFLSSPHAGFALRASFAVMCVCILAYLDKTAHWFRVQRGFWAAIIIAISMTRLAGQTVFTFMARMFATLLAVVASFAVWYIPDGHVAGVIVFEYIWLVLSAYIFIKKPRYFIIGLLCSIYSIILIGYQIQVQKIGIVEASAASGQPYYPMYELAPYRLATVIIGLAVAFFWSVFPFPISETAEIRKDLGATLFLNAKHFALVQSIAKHHLNSSPDCARTAAQDKRAAALEKARSGVFRRLIMLGIQLRANVDFEKWTLLPFGGKFPKDRYIACIDKMAAISEFATLMSYASQSFMLDDPSDDRWRSDFVKAQRAISQSGFQITIRLCLLSNSLLNKTPLPPHLNALDPHIFLNSLQAIDKDVLSVRNIAEPGYAAFATMQTCARHIVLDTNELTNLVRELVGELDFSPMGLTGDSTPLMSGQPQADSSSGTESEPYSRSDKFY